MYGNWWWNREWKIRDAAALGVIFDEGDRLLLEPNDTTGTPSFFWIRFDNHDSEKSKIWKNRYLYAVGTTAAPVTLEYCWDDTKSADRQPDGVRNEFNRAAHQVRSVAENPYVARLEGHVYVTDHYEIFRIFCFQGVQPDGRDWITFDALQIGARRRLRASGAGKEEDGTAHGDPP